MTIPSTQEIIMRLRAEGMNDWNIASYLRGWRHVGERYGRETPENLLDSAETAWLD